MRDAVRSRRADVVQVTDFLLGAGVSLAVLVWGGRLVAAHSEGARRKIIEASGTPAMRPPSSAMLLASGLVAGGAAAAVTLLVVQAGVSVFAATALVLPFAFAVSHVVRRSDA